MVLVRSDSRRVVSFVPTWTTTLSMELGSESKRDRNLSKKTGTVAQGRQYVIALKNQIFLVMESSVLSVLGEERT